MTARAKLLGVALSTLALLAMVAVSLSVGSALLPLSTVWESLVAPNGGIDHNTVLKVRVPRTVLAVMVGAALAVAGAVIQALTRNPLADPGILGVNAGASFAIVLGVAFLGITRVNHYLWLSFAGAVIAGILVYAISGRGKATPVRLTLVGVALSSVFMGVSQTLTLIDPETFDRMRFWGAGTIADRPAGTIPAVAGFIVVGIIVALACSRSLNALALGDDLATAVGSRTAITRTIGFAAVTLLCGAATAAAGPIAFVGLMIPHTVRWLTGPDQRWILPFTLILGPVLMLVSDVVGRLLIWPAELQVGVITALVGAPVLIVMVRRARTSNL